MQLGGTNSRWDNVIWGAGHLTWAKALGRRQGESSGSTFASQIKQSPRALSTTLFAFLFLAVYYYMPKKKKNFFCINYKSY